MTAGADQQAREQLAAMSYEERQQTIMAYAGSLYMTGMDWDAAITMAQMEASELLRGPADEPPQQP